MRAWRGLLITLGMTGVLLTLAFAWQQRCAQLVASYRQEKLRRAPLTSAANQAPTDARGPSLPARSEPQPRNLPSGSPDETLGSEEPPLPGAATTAASDSSAMPVTPPLAGGAPAAGGQAGAPPLIQPPMAAGRDPLFVPGPLSFDPEKSRRLPSPPAPPITRSQPSAVGSGPAGQSYVSSQTRPSSAAQAPRETLHLMRQLCAADPTIAAGARAELMSRGLSAVELELARQLFDPRPEVRKQLACSLPSLQSIDAVPWLLWLSHDAEPEVRLTAITLLATTADPTVLDEIERLAQGDADPRIQRQAERIARLRIQRRQ